MTNLLARLIALINALLGPVCAVVFAPIGWMPGWLSNTIISCVTGVFLLILFKYTSNQKAIGRVRDHITADLLTLKLFKDSLAVTLQAQGRLFGGALLLLVHAVRPMLVMLVPVCLLLSQLGLWYQARPLRPGEYAVVTMKLGGGADAAWPDVRIASMPSADIAVGPVRVLSKREICWEIRAREAGTAPIVFQVGGQAVEKQLAAGNGYMRVSARRPGLHWTEVLYHPTERPFRPGDAVQSIDIDYPGRRSWTSGTNSWLIYFFAASLLFSLLFKPFLKVRL